MIASGKSNPSINSRKIGNFALQIVAFLIVPTYFTWGIITFSLLWYKYAWLPYGGRSTFPVEVVTCILVTALSIPMGALIRRGNVLEQYIPLVVGTCVLLIASGGVLYFMLYQTYVLFLDFIVSLCVLVCMAVLLSCILVTFIQITIHIRRKRKDRLRQHAASVSNITRTKRLGVDFENVDTSQLECQRLTEQVAVRPDTH